MAEEIGALRAKLSSDTAEFEEGMKRARKASKDATSAMILDFGKLRGGANNIADKIFSLKSALVGLATGAAAAALKSVLDGIGDIADSARDLGMTAEAYQEISFAAALAGVDTEKFNVGMGKLLKNIGEAATGNQTAIASFKALGVSLRDSNGNAKNTETIFTDVMGALGRISDPAQRAAAAMDLFGKSGIRFAGWASEGVDQMEAMRRKASELGLVLSNETVAAAEEAGDKLDTAGQIIKMNLNVALAELVPLLADVSNALSSPDFVDFLARLRWAVGDTIKDIKALYAVINEGGTTNRNAADMLPDFVRPGHETQRKERKVSDLLPKFLRPDEEPAAVAPAKKETVPSKVEAPAAVAAPIKKQAIPAASIDYAANKKAMAVADEASKQRARFAKEEEMEMQRELAALAREQEARNEAMATISNENAGMREMIEAYRQGGDAVEQVRAKYDLLNDARRLNIDLNSEEGQAFQAQYQQNAALSKQLDEQVDAWRDMQYAGQDAAHTITDGLKGVLMRTSSLKDGLRSVVSQLADIALNALVFNPMQSALSSAISGGLI